MSVTHTQFVGSIPEKYEEHLGPLFFHFYAEDLANRVSIGDGKRSWRRPAARGSQRRIYGGHCRTRWRYWRPISTSQCWRLPGRGAANLTTSYSNKRVRWNCLTTTRFLTRWFANLELCFFPTNSLRSRRPPVFLSRVDNFCSMFGIHSTGILLRESLSKPSQNSLPKTHRPLSSCHSPTTR